MNYNYRTDLALEEFAADNTVLSEDRIYHGCKVNYMNLTDEQAKKYNKIGGHYYTIQTSAIKQHDYEEVENVIKALSKILSELLELLNIEHKDEIFIVGLGNSQITPDALGPLAINRILITRHLHEMNSLDEDKRIVSALAPGVMGQTGIETSDIIKAVIKQKKPKLVIVMDALASKSMKRVNQSIQITTAGINPGSGVGNKRKELSKKVLGTEVIAIGVPTVVDILSISNDVFSKLDEIVKEDFKDELEGLRPKLFNDLENDETIEFFVTPKGIDENIDDLADVLSRAINLSLHDV